MFLSILLLTFATFQGCASQNGPPLLVKDMNQHVVSESTAPGSIVYTLEAADPEDSPLKYSVRDTDYFAVDPSSGNITLIKELDHEMEDTIRMIVGVEDDSGNLVEIPVTVIVADENDNAPQFSQAVYDVQVTSNVSPGTVILPGIAVRDPDLVGENLEVFCLSPGICDLFSVIPTEPSSASLYRGNLVLKQDLNLEPKLHNINILATDGIHNSTAVVKLLVEDTNKHAPKFQGTRTVVIPENFPVGSTVTRIQAKVQDPSFQDQIAYKLVNPSDTFELDSRTGELVTKEALSRQSSDLVGDLNLDIRAEYVDSSGELRSTDESFTVIVQDVNDKAPTFEGNGEFFAVINENDPPGTPLVDPRIIVTDGDIGINSMFDLELIDSSGLFAVEPKSATGSTSVSLRLAKGPLDYENPNQQKFILLIVARESRTKERFSSTTTVTVEVQDENDNPPEFEQELYTAKISEMASPNTEVVRIKARDRDSGQFGESGLVYELVGNHSDKFLINQTNGVITVNPCETPGIDPCLDYEKNRTYYLTIKATDDLGNGHSAMTSLRIDLIDANDNAPHFEQTIFHAFIDEGSTKFEPPFRVQAIDEDPTSALTYSIVSGNQNGFFTIDSRTGEIRVVKPLQLNSSNAATSEVFTLTVQATDGFSEDNATLKISIRDVNNNRPVFSQQVYEATIPETQPVGSIVLQALATDSDFGENSKVSYKIERNSFTDFEMDPSTGALRVARKLQFDRRKFYDLGIIATDNGFPRLTGSATIRINVTDTNDKLPAFVPATQKAEVVKNATLKFVVHKLNVVDPDAELGSLVYSIEEPITAVDKDGREVRLNSMFKKFFEVNNRTGQVYVAENLDRATTAAVVTLTTVVRDTSASPVQEARGLLIITILDINDHAPTFVKPGTDEEESNLNLVVTEEQPIGSIVGVVTATDMESAIDRYEINPPSPYFAIDNVTGTITNKQRLDFETSPEFNFTVVAYDAGVPQMSSTAQVTVSLLNVNDQSPVFSSKVYNAKILENATVGTHVFTVSATDGDAGSFGLVTYSLTGENAKYFTIDAAGSIRVSQSEGLDREKHSSLTLLVAASDLAPPGARRTTIVPVEIELEDVNDNKPNFLNKDYRAIVAETVLLESPPPIVQVTAIDDDAGINSAVVYEIVQGNEDGLFRLDPVTGILYPNGSLLGKFREYTLVVGARDLNGTGPISDTATVTITVQSVNQHKPKFRDPSINNATRYVRENVLMVEPIIRLNAEDGDSGDNGQVTYHIRVGEKLVSETPEFRLNPVTGEMHNKVELDREAQSRYEILVVAKDQGKQVSYETLRLLTILVEDEDDNTAEFPPERRSKVSPYRFKIEENVRPDTAVGQVKAFDKDAGENARIFYHILEGNDGGWFYIDKTHGFIFNKVSLDREEREAYTLVIKATNDSVYAPNTETDLERSKRQTMDDPSVVSVHIDVIDINDNPPRFEKDTFYGGADYSANSGKYLLSVRASDPDEGINGTLSYSIRSSNLFSNGSTTSLGSVIPTPFHITNDGSLFTDQLMAGYNQYRFVLEVVAREEAPPFREDTARIHIWVYEPEQLARVVVAKPLENATAERELLGDELRKAAKYLMVVDEIRHHVEDDGSLNKLRSDVYVHGVDHETQSIAAVPEVLREIDLHYDLLRSYNDSAIVNVLPATHPPKNYILEPAIVALVALLIVLFVGFFMVIFVCCCIRNIKIPEPKIKHQRMPRPARPQRVSVSSPPPDVLNSTENPLWIEKYAKPYEEQELTMRVSSSDIESPANGSNMADNPYATIQKPRKSLSSIYLGDEVGESNDYATLDSPYRRTAPIEVESPKVSLSASTGSTTNIMTTRNGEPILVAELI